RYSAPMPTPARWATAAMGASGSEVKTVRAASRISWLLRAASMRRPLIGAGLLLMALLYTTPDGLNRAFRSDIMKWNKIFRSTSAEWRPAYGYSGIQNRSPANRPGRSRRASGSNPLARRAAWARLEQRRPPWLYQGAGRVLAKFLRLA